jgi:hypothetical protein
MYGSRNRKNASYLSPTIHGGGSEENAGYLGIGLALGVALGAALGIAIGNLALGIGFGIALSTAIALVLSSRQPGKNGDPERDAARRGYGKGDGA